MIDFRMASKQVYCVLDYETFSEADITLCGAYEYAIHPSTRLLCVAWRTGTFSELMHGKSKTKLWSPLIPSGYGEFKRALLDPSIILVAHNAFFEQVITRFVLSKIINEPYLKSIPHDRWVCTASMARALAFPGKLAQACAALRLSVQKDMGGHKLMLKLSKPRKPSLKDPRKRHTKKSDYEKLFAYCVTDVDAEVALFTSVRFLSQKERMVWLLDQKINMRGFLCDRDLVKKCLDLIPRELKRLEAETVRVTGGEVESTGQVAAIQRFLKKEGLDLPNLQKKTIEDVLKSNLATGNARSLLLLRQAAAKTSTAKYVAYEARSRSDGRVRDNLVFHGASTGRWSGAGVQIQNLPKPHMSESQIALAIEILLRGHPSDLEWLRFLFGNPLDVFSTLLRSVIKASPDKELFGGDFAGIEVRVLFWMAKHHDGIEAYIKGRDLYCEIAKEIYGYLVTKAKNAKERDVGKRAILGCGFGMGKDRFFESCAEQGQDVSHELAESAVTAYRRVHKPVVDMWSNLEKAAIAAVQKPGKRYTINRTTWFMEGLYLYCQLPSGRRLAYYGPEIRMKPTPWGQMKPTLYHWDVHPTTRQWVFIGTYGGKLTENVVQATARDFMVEGMIRVEKFGYEIILTVHDELLAEKLRNAGSVEEFERLMATVPEWGLGCPIGVEAWKGLRYKK